MEVDEELVGGRGEKEFDPWEEMRERAKEGIYKLDEWLRSGEGVLPWETYGAILFPRDEQPLGQLRMGVMKKLAEFGGVIMGGSVRRLMTGEWGFFSGLQGEWLEARDELLGEMPSEAVKNLWMRLAMLPFNEDVQVKQSNLDEVFESLKQVVDGWGEEVAEERQTDGGLVEWRVNLPKRTMFVPWVERGGEVMMRLRRGSVPQNERLELVFLEVGTVAEDGEWQDMGMLITVSLEPSLVEGGEEKTQRAGEWVNGWQKEARLPISQAGMEIPEGLLASLKELDVKKGIERQFNLQGLDAVIETAPTLPDGYERLWHLLFREMRYDVMALLEMDFNWSEIEGWVNQLAPKFHQAAGELVELRSKGKQLSLVKQVEVWGDLLVMLWKNPAVLKLFLSSLDEEKVSLAEKLFSGGNKVVGLIGDKRSSGELVLLLKQMMERVQKTNDGLLDGFVELWKLKL